MPMVQYGRVIKEKLNMKVYILSMQQVNNYGSVLQAYSLKKMIESLGNGVRFLAIEKGTDDALSIQCEKKDIDKKMIAG